MENWETLARTRDDMGLVVDFGDSGSSSPWVG